MRWTPLDAARLSTLTTKDSGERWLSVLADAGVERMPGDTPPQQAMSALYDAAWALSACDDAVTETRVTDKLHFSAPPGAWLALPGLYLGFIVLAAFRNDFGDRLATFGALWGLAAMVAIAILLWVTAATWANRITRRQQHDAARTERDHTARRAARARDALLAAPFVLRINGQRFLQHIPDLNRVEDQLRALPPADPGRGALQAQRAKLTEAITAHRRSPPAVWSDDGLRLSAPQPQTPAPGRPAPQRQPQ